MVKWILNRALVAFALYLAYLTWGGPLRQREEQWLASSGGAPPVSIESATSPYEQILRALQ